MGSAVAHRIRGDSWIPLKFLLREERQELNLTKTKQDDCFEEFMENFGEAMGGKKITGLHFLQTDCHKLVSHTRAGSFSAPLKVTRCLSLNISKKLKIKIQPGCLSFTRYVDC